jgi:dihydrofolate synthase/folylpolyglutamate synthase
MSDKPFKEMVAILEPHATQFIFTKPQISRAKDPADLQKLVAGSQVKSSIAEAIHDALSRAPAPTTILICGSLYLVGEARAMLQ